MDTESESERTDLSGLLGGTLAGMAIGACAMYVLDPDRGRRRRALLRDQARHVLHEARDGVGITARDVSNRTTGLFAWLASMVRPEHPSVETLEARVRSALGHAVSHPRAIRVAVDGQRVVLQGDVLADELNALLRRVASVQGVRLVNNQLSVHETPSGVASLQNGSARTSKSPSRGWSPTERLVVGAFGSALAAYGLTRDGRLGSAVATLGTGALLRAATNLDLGSLTGLGQAAGMVSIQKTINVNTSVDRVYRFWRNVENFGRFMSHVDEVRDLGDGISRWRVAGPAGYSAEWDAAITAEKPNSLIAWRTVGQPSVENSGSIRFQQVSEGHTRVDIHLQYRPPVGAIGHFINNLFGTDPLHSMEEDLARLKSLLEKGKTSINGHEIWLEDISGEEKQ